MSCWAALLVPNLPVALARCAEPALADGPLLLAAPGAPPRVAAASEAGLVGLTLRAARLRCPKAAVRPYDPAGVAGALATLREVLAAASPRLVALAPPPDAALAADLGRLRLGQARAQGQQLARAAAAALGLAPAVGLAAHATLAWLAAQVAGPGRVIAVPPGAEAAWLAVQPVELLSVAPELHARLRQLGLSTVGAVAALPVDALEAQFGAAGGALAALSRGREVERRLTLPRPPQLVVGWRFGAGAGDGLALDAALSRVARRLAERLSGRGQAARALVLTLLPADGPPLAAGRALAAPTGDHARLLAALRALLAEAAPRYDPARGGAIEQLRATVEVAPVVARQLELFAPAEPAEPIAARLARLAPQHARLLLRATLADPEARCLERRVRLVAREAP